MRKIPLVTRALTATLALLSALCMSALRPPTGLPEAPAPEYAGYTASDVSAPSMAPMRAAEGAKSGEALAGKYMAFGYVTASAAQRYWLDIEATGPTTLRITNLMDKGTTVDATFDPERQVITIVPQKLFNDPEYGDFIMYEADIEKKAYYSNRNVEFHINPDGRITIGNWGAFVTEGEKRGYANIHHREELFPARATITDYSLTKTGEEAVNTYPAVYIRENNNKILIKNFYNYGADVVLTVDSAGNVKALRYPIAQSMSSTGSVTTFYDYAVTNYVSPQSYKLVATGIPGTFQGDSIRLDRWAVSPNTTISKVYDLLEKSVITVPEEFVPFSSALTLEGKGTAESPYLVQTPADLLSLSSAVNYSGSYTVSKKAFSGIHFLQTADIDMAGVPNFEPIGYATTSTFAGIYDGGGHTISNLKVDRRGDKYAGLFGIIEAKGGVRNLTLESPVVKGTSTYIGAIAGQSKSPIANITVRNGDVGGGTANIGGIVGSTTNSIASSSFTGKINAGGFCGGIVGLANGSITDCFSKADLTVNKKAANVGGIAGSAAGDTVVVRNCVFDGIITDRFGNTTMGGIAGYFQKGRMESCMSSGSIFSKSITSNTTAIGGLVGLLSAATLTDCLSSGWIESPDAKTITGLVATVKKGVGTGPDTPKILNSLFTGLIVCPNGVTGNEFVGTEVVDYLETSGLIFDSQTSSRRSETGGMTTAALTSGEAVGSLNPELWTFAKGMYPALKAFETSDQGILAASPFFLNDGDDVGNVRSDFRLTTAGGIEWLLYVDGRYGKEGNGLKIDGDMARITALKACTDTLVAFKGNDTYKLAVLKLAPVEFEGEGTAESPFLIKTRDDLMAFSNAVDLQGIRYTGRFFRMANDIDMGGNTGFIGLSSQGKDGAFNGTFDGDGHAIKNWIVDRANLTDGKPAEIGSGNLMAGFFLYTGPEAVIRNLTIDASCSVMAGSHVAALVSQNNGTVENCRNEAHVVGLYNEAGGLVAANNVGAVIRDSHNTGAVDCGRQVAGGIAGANLGTIERCQNDGRITNDVFSTLSPARNLMGSIGGITGYNAGTIADCLGAGTVDAPKVAAAIVGENRETGRILTSLATAVLFDPDDASNHGAIMGTQRNSTDSLANIYYDIQLTARNAGNRSSQPGITGLTTAELTSGSLPEGFSAEVWSAAEGRYPVLKRFETSEAALFNASTFVSLPTEGRTDTRFFMRREATATAPEGATLSLADAKLTLTGTKIGFGSEKGVVTDTLVIAKGTMLKQIPLFASTGILPKGDGTPANPWLIETAADWNSVADLSNSYQLDLKDENFRVAADLDFTVASFSPICQNGTLRFQGALDGDGHKITNLKVSRTTPSTNGQNLGLVGILGEYGTISRLTLDASSSLTGFTNAGGFAGQNGGTIRDCVNRAEIATANTYAGGIAGYVIAGGRFIDCTNYGKVTSGGGQGGGIAGGNGADIGGLIKGCVNYGEITSEERSAGGIIGSGRVDVIGCRNEGTVHSVDVYAGGIVGYHTYNFPVDSCVNIGRVTSDAGVAGGIIGFMFSNADVSNCENEGTVISKAAYAGGIVGNTYKGNTRISDCVNRGAVSAVNTHAGGIVGFLTAGTDSLSMNYLRRSVNYGSVASGEGYAGGVVGESKAFTRIIDVANHGKVDGDVYVGGIAGCLLGRIDTAINTGAVTSKRYTVGGIAGVTNSAATITAGMSNVCNLGNVKSTGINDGTAYNVGGILGGGNIKITDAYNLGDLAGHKAVGGIVGLGVRGVDSEMSGLYYGTCISRSYNVGKIECLTEGNEKYCGHIVGASDPGLAYTVFEDNYFDTLHGSASTFANDSVATGLPSASITASLLGDAFEAPAEGLYPVLKAFADHDAALAGSSVIIFPESENRYGISQDFLVKAPEGTEWVSDAFKVLPEKITWSGLTPGQEYALTAVKGDFSRTFMLAVSTRDGVIQISDLEGQTPIGEEYYSIDGRRLHEAPESEPCIRVSIYSGGLRVSEKIMR